MLNWFKKHDLFKIVGIVLLVVAILTWVIPVSQYTGTEMFRGDISRTGILDLFGSGIYSLSTTLYQVTFILVLGGFYGVLSHINAYKNLVKSFANKISGHEWILIIGASLVFTIFASITSDIYQVLLFAPFIISVILALKLDKITALTTTFGSILVGRLGATYSTYAYGYVNSYFGTTFASEIITKIAILVFAFVLFNFFNLLHAKKTLSAKKKESYESEDKFNVVLEEPKKTKGKSTKAVATESKSSIWPIVVIFGIVLVIQVLGFISWQSSFEVTAFNDFHTWLTGIEIGGHPIFSYILGNANIGIVKPFGSWDLFNLEIIILLATLVITLIYKVGFDKMIEHFLEGAKKVSRLVLLLIMIYAVFILTVWNPFLPTVVDFIMGLLKNFNIYLASLATFVTSLFSVDMDYSVYSLGAYLATSAGQYSSLTGVIMNAMHGLASFIAPTSAILMLGLAYLNISYKDWMKYIWKFFVGLLAGLMIIFTIVRYM